MATTQTSLLEIEDGALRAWCDDVVVLLMQLTASRRAAQSAVPPTSLIDVLESVMEEEGRPAVGPAGAEELWSRALNSDEARRLVQAGLSPAAVCRWMLVGYQGLRVTRDPARTAALEALSVLTERSLEIEKREVIVRTLDRIGALTDLQPAERDSLRRTMEM